MNKIKELRKEKNITVAELAKELGISQSMLTNYENGNGTPRDESIWEKLSQIFGVQSNPEIAGSPRNSFRASVSLDYRR